MGARDSRLEGSKLGPSWPIQSSASSLWAFGGGSGSSGGVGGVDVHVGVEWPSQLTCSDLIVVAVVVLLLIVAVGKVYLTLRST